MNDVEERAREIQNNVLEIIDVLQNLESKVERLQKENELLQRFYNYFYYLYGTGLEVVNRHKNGNPESFDNLFDAAEQGMEESE
ncbi:hypothetical protein WD019_15345 [Fictibacillus sp. Mic-4]|uniref:hypothetical protein n=1 Tax=Fictibacillus TaxID=1329200 RepID=UPI00047C2FEC|nr:hypothetical protein [Fictibacillus gelatini]